MWHVNCGEPATLFVEQDSTPTDLRPGYRSARVTKRRQRRVADGLCSVARHAASDPPRRRHTVVLLTRAAAVRSELLEIAALVRCSTDPDRSCIAQLHQMLTNGCDSPLYNADVPAAKLTETLDRARTALTKHGDLADSPTSSQGGSACP